MAFGTLQAALTAVVIACGAMAVAPFVWAQTPDRGLRRDAFRAFAAGSEIGVSVRELSDDEVSKAGLEHRWRIRPERPPGRPVRVRSL